MKFLEYTILFYIEIAPFMLLGLSVVGLLNLYVKKESIIAHLGRGTFWPVVKASLLGVPLPLCSCGVVPTAVYFAKSGASNGAVVSFLISTPQTGLDSIAPTYGLLGPMFAVFRPLAAFFSGIFCGLLTVLFSGKSMPLKDNAPDNNVHDTETGTCESDCGCAHDSSVCALADKPVIRENKLLKFYRYAFVEFLDDISLHFVIGLVIAGAITFFIPADFFVQYKIVSGLPGMIIMALAGIPMYICATSSIPVAAALIAKGVSPGVAFVFLMAGPMTSASSIGILYKSLGKRVLAIYIFSGFVSAVLSGLLLDAIAERWGSFVPVFNGSLAAEGGISGTIYYAASAIFTVILAASLYRVIRSKIKIKSE